MLYPAIDSWRRNNHQLTSLKPEIKLFLRQIHCSGYFSFEFVYFFLHYYNIISYTTSQNGVVWSIVNNTQNFKGQQLDLDEFEFTVFV